MKRSTGIFMLLMLLGITGNAQTNLQGEMNNYVVSTTQIPQLQPIILTAEALKEEDGAKFGDFQIVMYGPNVKSLQTGKRWKPIPPKLRLPE
jgi:hypothetical protein